MCLIDGIALPCPPKLPHHHRQDQGHCGLPGSILKMANYPGIHSTASCSAVSMLGCVAGGWRDGRRAGAADSRQAWAARAGDGLHPGSPCRRSALLWRAPRVSTPFSPLSSDVCSGTAAPAQLERPTLRRLGGHAICSPVTSTIIIAGSMDKQTVDRTKAVAAGSSSRAMQTGPLRRWRTPSCSSCCQRTCCTSP